MMCCHRLSVLSIIATVVFAGLTMSVTPPWDDVRVKHAWNTVPSHWESLGPPPAETTIDLHIVLKARNEDALIDALYEVSSPEHPKYGAYLSKEEIADLVSPHPETVELVHSWLSHHGLPPSSISIVHGGSWLMLTDVPVSQANQLLGASYHLHRDTRTNDSTILRTVGYSLPTVLHAHVETVVPTTFFDFIRAPSVGAAAPANLNVGPRRPGTVPVVTPGHLRWLYNTVAYKPTAMNRNALGIAGYLDSYPSRTDLRAFMVVFRSEGIGATFTVEQVNDGGYDSSRPGDEGNVDMQYSQAIAYPTPVVYYSTGGKLAYDVSRKKPTSRDAFFAWLTFILEQTNIPQTITTSASADEKEVPLEYARTLCKLFQELGARGVSVLFSSGDHGVGTGDCKVKDGSGKIQFSPRFPASCPWVTSVGGTTSFLPEVAANISTGGFSIIFPRPYYQRFAVPLFLQSLRDKHAGLYNASGRGVPDISAQAFKYFVFTKTESVLLNGTSCAVPTAAAVISLLNDYMISNGKPPLGFLNPWLYGGGLKGLNDIISGSNPACGTTGFSAITGWDPVTGLGTPDFAELQRILNKTRIQLPNLPLPTPRPGA